MYVDNMWHLICKITDFVYHPCWVFKTTPTWDLCYLKLNNSMFPSQQVNYHEAKHDVNRIFLYES